MKTIALTIFLFFSLCITHAQRLPHVQEIERKLDELSRTTSPGLNETVDLSVSGVSVQEFLRSLAETNQLNINIDPSINVKVINNFTNEKVKNVILFLCEEYQLDIHFIGSILSFHPYKEAPKPIETKDPIYSDYEERSQLLSLGFSNQDLREVCKRITQKTNQNIIPSSSIANKKVSVYVSKLPIENALKKLAYANDLKLEKSEEGDAFLLSAEPTKATTPLGNRPGMGSSSTRRYGAQGFKPEFDEGKLTIKINYSADGKALIDFSGDEVPISAAIKAVSEELKINYTLFSEPQGNTTTKLKEVSYDDFLSILLQGTNHTFKTEAGIYLIGDRNLEGLRQNKVIQFQYRSLNEMLNAIPAELKKGVEIKEFKELNAILLSGSSPQINEIQSFVNILDQVVPMVMIEVIIIDIRKGDLLSTGVRAGLRKSGDTTSTSAGGTLLNGIDFDFSTKSIGNFLSTLSSHTPINLGKVSPNFYFGLSALEENRDVNIRQTPKLATLNGHEADLSIGETRYYSIQNQNTIGTQNPIVNTVTNFQQVEANLSITIKPIVSGDEQVTLDINVEISDFLETPTDRPPPSTNRRFKAMVRAKTDDMIVLGGIERDEKSESTRGTPFLSKIPVLKWIFSNRTKNKGETITSIFIKPTIVY